MAGSESNDSTRLRLNDNMSDVQKAKHEYSLHQDTLLWSRVQWLTAIQSAALAGIYLVRHDRCVSLLLAVLAIALTFLLLMIAERDHHQATQAFLQCGIPETPVDRSGLRSIRGLVLNRLIYSALILADVVLASLVVGGCTQR